MRRYFLTLSTALSALSFFGSDALAQNPPPQGQYGGQAQWSTQQGAYGSGYGVPPPPAAPSGKKRSTALEVGYLYVTAAAWGVGTGIWIDAEADIRDPGLSLIFPGILGVAAPVGVFALDQYVYAPAMPRGLPSSIATGLLVGAGEGLGIASYQWVSSDEENEWGFKGLARAEVIGSTLGGVAGYGFYYFLRPSPKSNVLVSSSIFWGSLIGTEFGAGASRSSADWGETNDSMSLGGLIGFNVALAGAAAVSTVWVPSWDQLGWMWGGLALGTVISLPVYLFYVNSEFDARHGLIFQGIAGALGIGAGALIGRPDRKGAIAEEENEKPKFARVRGATLVPIPGGVGAQVMGELW
jgi:hypothetical protein